MMDAVCVFVRVCLCKYVEASCLWRPVPLGLTSRPCCLLHTLTRTRTQTRRRARAHTHRPYIFSSFLLCSCFSLSPVLSCPVLSCPVTTRHKAPAKRTPAVSRKPRIASCLCRRGISQSCAHTACITACITPCTMTQPSSVLVYSPPPCSILVAPHVPLCAGPTAPAPSPTGSWLPKKKLPTTTIAE